MQKRVFRRSATAMLKNHGYTDFQFRHKELNARVFPVGESLVKLISMALDGNDI